MRTTTRIRVRFGIESCFRRASDDPKVVTAAEAFEMATIRGARALHLEKEIGSIEKGKRADLVVVDLNAPGFSPV